MHFQPKIKGGRDRTYSAIWHKLNMEVQKEADRHDVSKSWVIACAVAAFFNVNIPTYYNKKGKVR